MRLLAFLAISLLLTTAPEARARTFDPAPINALQAGVTTQAQAIAALGEPDSRAPNLNNNSTLLYEYEVVPEGETASIHITVVLLFDSDGKFVRYRVYRHD